MLKLVIWSLLSLSSDWSLTKRTLLLTISIIIEICSEIPFSEVVINAYFAKEVLAMLNYYCLFYSVQTN
jgi:hypothetical protein